MPAGTSTAVRTIPATTSRRSQDRWYSRTVRSPGIHLLIPLDDSAIIRASPPLPALNSTPARAATPKICLPPPSNHSSVGNQEARRLPQRRGVFAIPGGRRKECTMSTIRRFSTAGGVVDASGALMGGETAGPTMRAIVQDEYGPPAVLSLRDIDKPAIKADQVLVRVQATGLHVGDSFVVRGTPFPLRLATGLLKPRYGVPGLDAAGVVEAVGSNVTQFHPGDEVFGECRGT